MGRPHITVEVAVREAIGSISGVNVTDVRTMPPASAGKSSNLTRYITTVHGWSPSLHLHCMDWTASIRTDQPPEAIAREVLMAFQPHLALQRSRRNAGMALNAAMPFNTDHKKGEIPVRHMRIDIGLAELIRRESGRDLIDYVATSVADLHRSDLGNGLENAINSDDRIDGDTFSSLFEIGPHAFYDGTALNVPEDIPETMRTAAIGRPLGDVVTVPEFLKNHVISSIDDMDDMHFINVRPVLSLIGDLQP